jgi:hypothetical protein
LPSRDRQKRLGHRVPTVAALPQLPRRAVGLGEEPAGLLVAYGALLGGVPFDAAFRAQRHVPQVRHGRDVVAHVEVLHRLLAREQGAPACYGGQVPKLDVERALAIYRAMSEATSGGLLCSSHTPTLGGLAAACALAAIGGDLGAEIEFTIGGEKHTFNTTTTIFVPKGLAHCPIIHKRVGRPFILAVFAMGKEYPTAAEDAARNPDKY